MQALFVFMASLTRYRIIHNPVFEPYTTGLYKSHFFNGYELETFFDEGRNDAFGCICSRLVEVMHEHDVTVFYFADYCVADLVCVLAFPVSGIYAPQNDRASAYRLELLVPTTFRRSQTS